MKAKLTTANGGFVKEVEIPPFQKLPEALVWGSRFFLLAEQNAGDGIPVYSEGLAFYVVDLLEPVKKCGNCGKDAHPNTAEYPEFSCDKPLNAVPTPTPHVDKSECPKCHGSGTEWEEMQNWPCGECGGSGKVDTAALNLASVPTYLGEKVSTSGRITDLHGPTPDPEIEPATGQHKGYWVLSEAERAKGFVRPVRKAYMHVGCQPPKYPLRDLTPEEHLRYEKEGYVKHEAYPESELPLTGRFWTKRQLRGCGRLTSMALSIAETYAREPSFYGSTFCCACGGHFPVGAEGEFVWCDERGKPTEERVGT